MELNRTQAAMRAVDANPDTRQDDAALWAVAMNSASFRKDQIGRELWVADDLTVVSGILAILKKMTGSTSVTAAVHMPSVGADPALVRALNELEPTE